MKKATPWIVLLLVLGGLAAWYYSALQPTQDHPSVVTLPPAGPDLPQAQAEFPIDPLSELVPDPDTPPPDSLPALNESDGEISEQLAALVGAEMLGSYFVLEQVINRIVATVDSLDSRQVAPLVLPVKPAAGTFMTQGLDTLSIHPGNAQRYAPFVRIAATVDTAQAVELYVRYYPLFQEAYAELGKGDDYFNDRLVEIIDHLLATPEPEGPLELVKPEAVYVFADPELEALSAGQKLMLRIGSSNAAVIMDKLTELRVALTQPR